MLQLHLFHRALLNHTAVTASSQTLKSDVPGDVNQEHPTQLTLSVNGVFVREPGW